MQMITGAIPPSGGTGYMNGGIMGMNPLSFMQMPRGAGQGVESFAPTREASSMLMQVSPYSNPGAMAASIGQNGTACMMGMFTEMYGQVMLMQMMRELMQLLMLILTGKKDAGAGSGGSSQSSAGTGVAGGAGGGSSDAAVPVDGSSTSVSGRPNGLQGIISEFGQPGTGQVTVQMPAGPGGKMISVTCHRKIAGRMKAAFEEVKAKGLSHLIHSFDGSFCNRNKRGGSTKSVHSWGIAFDVNAGENPMGSSRQTEGQRQLAAIFEKYGFHQLPNDPMHFQFATGY